jgi:hypothetical protein
MENYKELIKEIVEGKNKSVSELIGLINTATDNEFRAELIFTLVDNFKDDRITLTLVNLIKR